jgi:hypothetical protein
MRDVADLLRFAPFALSVAAVLALSMVFIVAIERSFVAYYVMRRRRLEARYRPIVHRAVAGDDEARRELITSPPRHRLDVAAVLITPLIDDRDPRRITSTRALARALSIVPYADRYLSSRLWWRRAVALRALGLIQFKERTAAIVAALDDSHPDVRAAALDALTDLHDVASLPAIVVRLNDASLHRGRRLAALSSFGTEAEPFVLELGEIDPEHRLKYARALAIVGTVASQPALCRWTSDSRADVAAAAFEALARIPLDDATALLARQALTHAEAAVRAMAAHALRRGRVSSEIVTELASHLDDVWVVAVQAARTLQALGGPGMAALHASAARPTRSGQLARQMLWEARAR